MNRVLKIFLTIAFIVSTLNAGEPTREQLITNMIRAYGGEKNIKQLNSYMQVWDVETKTNDGNGTDNRRVDMPYFLRTELIYPDKTETRVLIKDYGTKDFGTRKILAQGPMLDAMKLQLMRLFNPLVLRDNLKEIRLFIKKKYYLLSLKRGSITAEYFVSKKSFLVNKVIGRLKMGSRNMEFLTLYDDYKPVLGVMVNHKEIKYAGDVQTAVMRLKAMRFLKTPKRHR